MKFTTRKVRANKILPDDHIKIAGRMYRVSENTLSGGTSSRRHILAYPIEGGDLDERISVFLPSLLKFKIYNQKTKK